MVHQLASRPGLLVDPYALIAAFEQLADICQETNHPERRRYEAIFKQCRLLVREPRLASVLIQLLGGWKACSWSNTQAFKVQFYPCFVFWPLSSVWSVPVQNVSSPGLLSSSGSWGFRGGAELPRRANVFIVEG